MKWIIQIAQKEEGTVYSPKATSISKLFSSDMVLQKLLILLAKAYTILLLQKEDKFLTIASCVLHICISFMSYQQLWRKQNQRKRTNLQYAVSSHWSRAIWLCAQLNHTAT